MSLAFETLTVRGEGAVLLAEISAPPMNLLGPALVRDLVQTREGEIALARMLGHLADR